MPPVSRKKIHIVGGGLNQVPLVQRAKARGLSVLVTDMYADAPAQEYADEFVRVDTTELEQTLAVAKDHHIDFITTDMTDVAVPTVAYIAEALGLPGIGYETAIRFTNKYVMRKVLSQKLPAVLPESCFFERPADALEYCRSRNADQTRLVKPINSQGSKGVFILAKDEPKTWGDLVHTAFNESQQRGLLVERYVEGFEYSVETFVRDGVVHNLTLTKKYHYDQNPCLDERNTFLGDVAPELEEKLFRVNAEVIRALGLPFGMTHAEYKIENGQVYLMEIAARGAGGGISSFIVPYLTGFDTLNALISIQLGEPFDIKVSDYKDRFAVLKFFNFAPGKIKKIIRNEPAIQEAHFFTLTSKVGDVLVPPRDSRDRPGFFIVKGEDRQKVLRLEKSVEAAVRIEYEK